MALCSGTLPDGSFCTAPVFNDGQMCRRCWIREFGKLGDDDDPADTADYAETQEEQGV